MAIALKGNLLNAPETYMDKIAVGSDIPSDAVDLDNPLEINLKNIVEMTDETDLKDQAACAGGACEIV